MAIKRIRESEEMYLETILLLRGKKAEVHSIDVAEELGYVKSSVSRGVNLLKARGYIEIAPFRCHYLYKSRQRESGGDLRAAQSAHAGAAETGSGPRDGGKRRLPHRTRHFGSFVCVIQRIYRRISLYKKGELRKSAVSFFKIFFIGIKKS